MPLRRVLTQRPSLESTHQRSACTPSMSVEQIPDLMMTERKCMREDGKLSELNTLNLAGKRNTMNGARDLPEDSPSGLERDQARKGDPETPEGGEEEEAAAAEEEEYDEEEEDEEEYDEEEAAAAEEEEYDEEEEDEE